MGVGGGGGLVWELGGSLRRDNICPHQIPFSSSDGGRMPFGAARGNGLQMAMWKNPKIHPILCVISDHVSEHSFIVADEIMGTIRMLFFCFTEIQRLHVQGCLQLK